MATPRDGCRPPARRSTPRVSLLHNRFLSSILAYFPGRTLSTRFNRFPERHTTGEVNRSQITQGTAEPYEFSPAELVVYDLN
jgi:hypothetical protein